MSILMNYWILPKNLKTLNFTVSPIDITPENKLYNGVRRL